MLQIKEILRCSCSNRKGSYPYHHTCRKQERQVISLHHGLSRRTVPGRVPGTRECDQALSQGHQEDPVPAVLQDEQGRIPGKGTVVILKTPPVRAFC